jgi:hypothetical protein
MHTVTDKRRAQTICEAWNGLHPIGQPVRLRQQNDQIVLTRTSSTAVVLNNDLAAVLLEGIPSYCPLERVIAVRT